MIASAVVTIVLNGAIVPTFAPARISGGQVAAPLAPVVTRIASRAAYDPGAGTVVVVRASRSITVRALFVADDVPYVALGPLVRALGGSVAYDGRTKTLVIDLVDDGEIASPAPFDPNAPQVAPTMLFTPEPPRPTPRPVDTSIPRPRRTAIPAVPSQPVLPGVTDPRR